MGRRCGIRPMNGSCALGSTNQRQHSKTISYSDSTYKYCTCKLLQPHTCVLVRVLLRRSTKEYEYFTLRP